MPQGAQDPLQMQVEERLAALAPRRFADWEPLGEVPLGQAWRLTDTTDGAPCRCEVLAPARLMLLPVAQQHQIAHWLEESVRLAATLQRKGEPLTPAVRLADPTGVPPFVIREWHAGITLAELIQRKGTGARKQLPIAVALPALQAVAGTLARAHATGISVPGLAPEHLLLVEPGQSPESPRALLLQLRPFPTEARDPRWLSPEALQHPQTDSAPNDAYALGAIFYAALTGYAPFDEAIAAEHGTSMSAEETAELRRQFRTYRPHPTPISEFVPGIAPALNDLVLRLLARDPEQRLSAQEAVKLLRDLDQPPSPLLGALKRVFAPATTAAAATPPPLAPETPRVASIDFDPQPLAPAADQPRAPLTHDSESEPDQDAHPAPRDASTWQRPALAAGIVALVALSLWAATRPPATPGINAADEDRMFRDLSRQLIAGTVAPAPEPEPLDEPEPAVTRPPKTSDPDPPPPEPTPDPVAEPQPETPVPVAIPIAPPEAITPTPEPTPAPPTEELPTPEPAAESIAPAPTPATPAPVENPTPAEKPDPSPVPTDSTDLFALDATQPASTAAGSGPSLEVPTATPTPALEPAPRPGPVPLKSSAGDPLFAFPANERQVWSIDISPDGRAVASGGRDENAALWDITNGKALGKVSAGAHDHTNWITTVAYSRDGRYLATGSDDASVKVWDLANGRKLIHTYRTPGDGVVVRALDFDRSANRLVIGYGDGRGTIRLLDLKTFKEIPTTLKHGSAMRALMVSNDGQLLATGGQDNEARLWNLKSGKLVATLSGHRGWVQSLAFSGKGALVTGSSDGSLRVWSTSDGTLLGHIPTAHKGGVYAVAFRSSDGLLLASGGADNAVRLWDMRDGTAKGSFGGHAGIVTSLKFTPKGNRLVSATLQDGYSTSGPPSIRIYAVN